MQRRISETGAPRGNSRSNLSCTVALLTVSAILVSGNAFGQSALAPGSASEWETALRQLEVEREGLSIQERAAVEGKNKTLLSEQDRKLVSEILLAPKLSHISESPEMRRLLSLTKQIVRDNAEPAYALCREPVCTDNSGVPQSMAIRARRGAEVAAFARANADLINAVATIEIEDEGATRQIGTATLVVGGYLVTNKHVAHKLIIPEEPIRGSNLMRTVGGLRTHRGWITFGRRDLTHPSGFRRLPLPVDLTCYFLSDGSDVAIFHIADINDIVAVPIPESGKDKVEVGDPILLLGYPSELGESMYSEAVRAFGIPGVQGLRLDILRASPGVVMPPTAGTKELFHNAQTCPGSSGSPVFRQADGVLVAIHSGQNENNHALNKGVPVNKLRELLAVVARP